MCRIEDAPNYAINKMGEITEARVFAFKRKEGASFV